MELDISKAVASNNAAEDTHTISSMNMDGVSDGKETEYTISRASEYWGYFNQVGDLKSAILMKAIWNVGKGYTVENTRDEKMLDSISGWGKECFDDILFNLCTCRYIFGDAFAEIIRDKKTGRLINLKVLNPTDVKIVVNGGGRIKRYELVNPKKTKPVTFDPKDILHLTNNRLGNQIHGISDIEGMEKTILADDQSFEELQKIISFQAKPFIIFKMKTDDDKIIDEFVEKVRRLRKKGDDLFVPDDENVLSWEVVQVNPSSILMEWRTEVRNRFYRQLGMPLILFGSSGSTESGGKIEYTGHEQVWEYEQRYIEKAIWNQLAIKIDLISPVSLLENLKNDQAKDAQQGMEIQPNDLKAGVGK